MGVLLLVLAGCGTEEESPTAEDAAPPDPEPDEPPTGEPEEAPAEPLTLRVASAHLNLLSNVGVLLVADSMGYYAEEGLEVEFQSFAGGGDNVRAVTSGEFDLGVGSMFALVTAYQAGEPMVLLANSSYSPDSFVVLADSDLQSIEDVRGRTIGYTSPASVTHGEAILSMQRAGIGLDEVELVGIGGLGDLITALREGVVDVAASVEPIASQLEDDGVVRKLWEIPDLVGEAVLGATFTTTDSLQRNEQAIAAFIRAQRRATELCTDDPRACAEAWVSHPIMDTLEEGDLDVAERAIAATPFVLSFTPEALALVEEIMSAVDLLEAPIDWEDVLDQRFLESDERVEVSG